MVDHSVEPGERRRGITGDLAALDQQLRHRHHLPVDLVPLTPLQLVLARLLGLDQPRDAKGPAVPPATLQRSGVPRLPVASERHLDLRPLRTSCAIEECGDILLAVGAGEAFGVGIDDGVHPQADPCALGNILDQLHLRTVVPDPVDVVSFPRAFQETHLLQPGGDPGWCPRLTGRLGRRAITRGNKRDPTVPPPSLASEAASHPPPCARATSAPPSKSYSYT